MKTIKYADGGYVTRKAGKVGRIVVTEEQAPNQLPIQNIPQLPITPVKEIKQPEIKKVRNSVSFEKLFDKDGNLSGYSPIFTGNWSTNDVKQYWNNLPNEIGGVAVSKGDSWKALWNNISPGTTNKDWTKSTMATGGLVQSAKVEVEGQESAELPNGSVINFNGPSHENGGIPINLPIGTKVYSDRITIDGKTMKQRKDSREKAVNKLESLLTKNPADAVAKNSLKRVQQVNAQQEAQDMQIQQMIGASKQKMALGGEVSGVETIGDSNLTGDMTSQAAGKGNSFPWATLINGVVQIVGQLAKGKADKVKNPLITENSALRPYANGGIINPEDEQEIPKIEEGYTRPVNPLLSGIFDSVYNPNAKISNNTVSTPIDTTFTSAKTSPTGDNSGRSASAYTAGDWVGMLGNAIGSVAPLVNTLNNRKNTTPNVNFFKTFGKDALEANQSAMGLVNSQKQKSMEDAKVLANTSKASARNSAQGINTQRALLSLIDKQSANNQLGVEATYAQQLMSLLGQKSSLLNQRDSAVMQGEQNRDLADRQDRDNFYTQLGRDYTNLAQGITNQGRAMNTHQQNDDITQLLSQSSKYGLTYTRNKKGELQITKNK